jgi:hypothetical protein
MSENTPDSESRRVWAELIDRLRSLLFVLILLQARAYRTVIWDSDETLERRNSDAVRDLNAKLGSNVVIAKAYLTRMILTLILT